MAVDAPLPGALDYAWLSDAGAPGHGHWLIVPLGKRQVLGLAVDRLDPSLSSLGQLMQATQVVDDSKIKPAGKELADMPTADPEWIALMAFAARYYRRPFGVVALGSIPKWLRDIKNHQPRTTAARIAPTNFSRLIQQGCMPSNPAVSQKPEPPLNAHQKSALAQIQKPGAYVLNGVTGSGKTRVYTEAARQCLLSDPSAQVLMMVPEIGLTPQLVERFTMALPDVETVVLHSEITERERARLWLRAATGQARLVIGTRLAIMTPLPGLALIMIDEEHDHSYKQQEGMRYSARDLAVWRAQQRKASLVLGSATPSIETWAQIARGRYQRLSLPERATGEPHAPIRLVDTLKDPAREGLSETSRAAIAQVLSEKGQVLVFLNRRGYAPVLSCASCGWSSQCEACSVATVLHKPSEPGAQWRLQCHHCGLFSRAPRQCPDCGDTDLQPIGRGVQRLEQTLQEAFPQARIVRIDRDTVKQAKHLQAELDRIERSEVDIVVGTQMLAKGHDFAHMRLVVVADADTQLVNPDFRAPERLFATLMQVAGRAGRHEQTGGPAQVLIQTRYPQHRLYRYLLAQDVEGFAQAEMADREQAGLPPFTFMAAIRASHGDSKKAQQSLRQLATALQTHAKSQSLAVSVYGPVARYPETQAGRWRGQLLVESASRNDLHQLLGLADDWMLAHRALDPHVDIDPHEV